MSDRLGRLLFARWSVDGRLKSQPAVIQLSRLTRNHPLHPEPRQSFWVGRAVRRYYHHQALLTNKDSSNQLFHLVVGRTGDKLLTLLSEKPFNLTFSPCPAPPAAPATSPGLPSIRLCLFGGGPKESDLAIAVSFPPEPLAAAAKSANFLFLFFFLSRFRWRSASLLDSGAPPGAGELAFPLPFTSVPLAETAEPCLDNEAEARLGARDLSFPRELLDFAREEDTTTEGGRAFRPSGVPGRDGGPPAAPAPAFVELGTEACTACIAGEAFNTLLAGGGRPFLATGGPADCLSVAAAAVVDGFFSAATA